MTRAPLLVPPMMLLLGCGAGLFKDPDQASGHGGSGGSSGSGGSLPDGLPRADGPVSSDGGSRPDGGGRPDGGTGDGSARDGGGSDGPRVGGDGGPGDGGSSDGSAGGRGDGGQDCAYDESGTFGVIRADGAACTGLSLGQQVSVQQRGCTVTILGDSPLYGLSGTEDFLGSWQSTNASFDLCGVAWDPTTSDLILSCGRSMATCSLLLRRGATGAGGMGGAGAGGAGAGGAGAGGAGGAAGKRIFVTSNTYPGYFGAMGMFAGGLGAGDAFCRTAAQSARLGGTWRAWLSDAATNAIDRITDVGPWRRLDDAIVFASKAGLGSPPLATIDRDESGNVVPGTFSVWTGTKPDGTRATNCQSWTGGPPETGAYGTSGVMAPEWTQGGTMLCEAFGHLYCIEQ